MPILSEYLYPSSDRLTISWSGIPNNNSKYLNIDEGVTSPSDVDKIYKTGLLSNLNGQHEFQFNLNSMTVLPSSSQLNLRINASGSDILDGGNLFLERARLLYQNSGVIMSYEYKSVGEPIYSWGLSSDYSNNTIILSGLPLSIANYQNPICDIRLSGNFTEPVPGVDSLSISVSALEFINSGTTNVHNYVTECLQVIDASGFPISDSYPYTWIDTDGNYVENSPSWHLSISNGVHNPNDTTYISSRGIPALLPVSTSGTIGTWLNQNFVGSSDPDWIASVNSGVINPIDTSWIRPDINGMRDSPKIIFNKSVQTINEVNFRFRCKKEHQDDEIKLSGIILRNANDTVLNDLRSTEFLITNYIGFVDYSTGFYSTNWSNWTVIDNYLEFIVSNTGAPISGLLISEIDIDVGIGTDAITSPFFYFNKPTLDAVDGGASICFRATNAGSEEFPVSLSNIQLKNSDATEIISFEDINFTTTQSYINYCGSGFLSGNFTDINHMSFGVTVPSGHLIQYLRFSEIEICCTGIDPVSSSYIPLYISAVGASNSGLDLYIGGAESASSGIDLFINGPDFSSSGIPLYISANDSSSSGIPLYIEGFESSNSGISLYIDGVGAANSGLSLYIQGPIPVSSFMPLFLKADTIPNLTNNFPLFTYSTTNSGIYNQFPLFIGGEANPGASMPLFLLGVDHADINSSMPLFLKTPGNLDGSMPIESGIPLYLHNGFISANSGISLYINNSQEGTSGYIPLNASMPLYIARDSEGYESRIPLFLKVSDISNSGLPLYTFGAYLENSGIPLSIPYVKDINNSGMVPLITHGH